MLLSILFICCIHYSKALTFNYCLCYHSPQILLILWIGLKSSTRCGRVHFEHRHRKWLVITVRPTTSVRKSPRKILPPHNTPDSFCRRFTRQNHRSAALRKRELVGARPLHLANVRPFGRLKAPLGLSLLRCAAQTRACLWQAEQTHHANNEKQEVPTGELPVVHIAIVCGFWQGASAWAHPVFVLRKNLRNKS